MLVLFVGQRLENIQFASVKLWVMGGVTYMEENRQVLVISMVTKMPVSMEYIRGRLRKRSKEFLASLNWAVWMKNWLCRVFSYEGY